MSANQSTAGWSIDKRRGEIHRILKVLVDNGLERAEAIDLLARRFLVGFNTVEGWVSEGGAGTRAPPDWKVLEILRYELGIVPVRKLIEWSRGRQASGKTSSVTRLRSVGRK